MYNSVDLFINKTISFRSDTGSTLWSRYKEIRVVFRPSPVTAISCEEGKKKISLRISNKGGEVGGEPVKYLILNWD